MLKTRDLRPCLAVFTSALRPKGEGSSPKKLRRDSKQAPGSFDSFFALRKAIAFATPLKMGVGAGGSESHESWRLGRTPRETKAGRSAIAANVLAES